MAYRRQSRNARPWAFDMTDGPKGRYQLHDEQLANLVIGREQKARAALIRRNTIRRLMGQGKSVADVVLLTGYSRAAIYRLAPVVHLMGEDDMPFCGVFAPDALTTRKSAVVTCQGCRNRLARDPLIAKHDVLLR